MTNEATKLLSRVAKGEDAHLPPLRDDIAAYLSRAEVSRQAPAAEAPIDDLLARLLECARRGPDDVGIDLMREAAARIRTLEAALGACSEYLHDATEDDLEATGLAKLCRETLR